MPRVEDMPREIVRQVQRACALALRTTRRSSAFLRFRTTTFLSP